MLSRIEQLLGDKDGYNSQDKIWRNAGPRNVKLEFGSVPNLGDETKYQGRPHDLLVFDEAANFLQQQVTFLLGWNRSTRPGVHSQALLTFNPPTTAEAVGSSISSGPWIDKAPMYPAAGRAALLRHAARRERHIGLCGGGRRHALRDRQRQVGV